MSIRYFIWHLVSPGNLLGLLLVVGAALTLLGRRRWGPRLMLVAAAGFLAFLVLPLAAVILDPLEERFPVPADQASPVQGIVLLTGAIDVPATEAAGQPIFRGFAERLTMTAMLARAHPEAAILVTGGHVAAGLPTEAAEHAALLVSLGVKPGRILLEERARNTCENARFSKEMGGVDRSGRWLLVTSAFHMPRAVACFRKAGWPEVVPFPAGYISPEGVPTLAGNLSLFSLGLHEWVGLLAYRLMGETDELFPAPAAP